MALRRWRDLTTGAPPRAALTAWAGATGDWPFLPRAAGQAPGPRGLRVGRRPGPRTPAAPGAARRHGAGSRPDPGADLPQLQAIDGIPQVPCQRRYWKGHYLRDFGDEAIGAFVLTRARTECGAPKALARWPGSSR